MTMRRFCEILINNTAHCVQYATVKISSDYSESRHACYSHMVMYVKKSKGTSFIVEKVEDI